MRAYTVSHDRHLYRRMSSRTEGKQIRKSTRMKQRLNDATHVPKISLTLCFCQILTSVGIIGYQSGSQVDGEELWKNEKARNLSCGASSVEDQHTLVRAADVGSTEVVSSPMRITSLCMLGRNCEHPTVCQLRSSADHGACSLIMTA